MSPDDAGYLPNVFQAQTKHHPYTALPAAGQNMHAAWKKSELTVPTVPTVGTSWADEENLIRMKKACNKENPVSSP